MSRSLSRLYPDSATRFDDGDFFRLTDRRLLARETEDYVPQLIAAAAIGRDPERYGFLAPAPGAPRHDSVRVGELVSLEAAAHAIGVRGGELRALNPQYLRGVTPPGSPSWVRLPDGLSEALEAALPRLPRETLIPERRDRPHVGSLIRVRRGDTVESLAEHHGVDVNALRRANALPDWYELKPGQSLRLPGG